MLSITPASSMLAPRPTTNTSVSSGASYSSPGLPTGYAPPPGAIYTPPPNYSCTPGYCVQQMQALLNMAITRLGGSHIVAVDGNVGQDTVDSVIIMGNSGIPQFALVDVSPDVNWVTTNAPSYVASLAAYLNIDPSSLLPPAPPPPPPSSDLPPTYTPPSVVSCPDGSSAPDISLCPPTAGVTTTITPPSAPPSLLPSNWTEGLMYLATDYWYVPAGLALLGAILLFSRRKRT